MTAIFKTCTLQILWVAQDNKPIKQLWNSEFVPWFYNIWIKHAGSPRLATALDSDYEYKSNK